MAMAITFPVTEAGTTTVLWTFDDGNGNIATAQQKIVINTIELIATEKATCLRINQNMSLHYQYLAKHRLL
jgi:hypothetical protein